MRTFVVFLGSGLLVSMLTGLGACAPISQTAQVSIEVRHPSKQMHSSALSSGTFKPFSLAQDECYALHITGDAPALHRAPAIKTCANGPAALGEMLGLFAYGATIAVEVPPGANRRFDLISIPESELPNGVTCDQSLDIATGLNSQGGLELNSALENVNFKLIATATATIKGGENTVILDPVAESTGGAYYDCIEAQDLYFVDQGNAAWSSTENWFVDAEATQTAGRLPRNGDSVFVLSNFSQGPVKPIQLAGYDGTCSDDASQTTPITILANKTANLRAACSWGGSSQADATVNFNDNSSNFSNTLLGNIVFLDFSNNQASIASATFRHNSENRSELTDSADFFENSANSGTVNGLATFHSTGEDQCDNDGTVASAIFYGTSVNNGEVSGTASFMDTSLNSGILNGDATFANGSHNESVWINKDAFFYDESTNTGDIAGSATFNHTSQNSGTVGGNATFNNESINFGTVSGDATFNDSSVLDLGGTINGVTIWGAGSINGPLAAASDIYFYTDYTAPDMNWSAAGNWWHDLAHSIPAQRTPAHGDFVHIVPDSHMFYDSPPAGLQLAGYEGALPYSGTENLIINANGIFKPTSGYWHGSTNATATVTFSGNASNLGMIYGNATFLESSSNALGAKVQGNAEFIGSLDDLGDPDPSQTVYNYGTVDGDATFTNSNSSNSGTVSGNATFNNAAINNNNSIFVATATFIGGSDNRGTVQGIATFTDSINSGTVESDATFSGGSWNTPTGVVLGSSTFSGTSENQGYTGGPTGSGTTATFDGSSKNTGTVTDDAEFYGDSHNDAIVEGYASFYATSVNTGTIYLDANFDVDSSNNGTVSGSIVCTTSGTCNVQ